jgi:hypothetical protein
VGEPETSLDLSFRLITSLSFNAEGEEQNALRGIDKEAGSLQFDESKVGLVFKRGENLSSELSIGAKTPKDGSSLPITISQAYVELTPPLEGGRKFLLSFGLRDPWRAAEHSNPLKNYNISRSWGSLRSFPKDFGIRLGFGSKDFFFLAGINNGGDDVADPNESFSVFAGFEAALGGSRSLSGTFFAGPEGPIENNLSFHGGLVFRHEPKGRINLLANCNYGAENEEDQWNSWYSCAASGAFPISKSVQAAGRVEKYHDEADHLDLLGITGGVNFLLWDNLRFRIEIRQDASLDEESPFNDQSEQMTLGFMFLYGDKAKLK